VKWAKQIGDKNFAPDSALMIVVIGFRAWLSNRRNCDLLMLFAGNFSQNWSRQCVFVTAAEEFRPIRRSEKQDAAWKMSILFFFSCSGPEDVKENAYPFWSGDIVSSRQLFQSVSLVYILNPNIKIEMHRETARHTFIQPVPAWTPQISAYLCIPTNKNILKMNTREGSRVGKSMGRSASDRKGSDIANMLRKSAIHLRKTNHFLNPRTRQWFLLKTFDCLWSAVMFLVPQTEYGETQT
jgi:hypothetical protein